MLDVPAAFHTELMEEVKEPFGHGLAELTIEPPRIPVLSSVTNRYVADPADIRDNLVVQMTQPVHYADLVQRLADEGTNVFVEVGPRQVLTGLHKRTFGEGRVAMVSCDHSKRGGLQQLLFARACVETTGALDADSRSPHSALHRRSDASPETAVRDGGRLGSRPTRERRPRRLHREPVCRVEPAAIEVHRHHADRSTPFEPVDAEPVEVEIDGLNVLRLAGTPVRDGSQARQSAAAANSHGAATLCRPGRHEVGPDSPTSSRPLSSRTSISVRRDLEELRGIADGAGVTFAAILAHNLRLYLDAGAGGLHFAVTAESNPGDGLLHAANEDLQRALCAFAIAWPATFRFAFPRTAFRT